MASDAIAGTDSGRTIFTKIDMWLAPSTRAASITSLGRAPMKFLSRKIASGIAKIECAIQIDGTPDSCSGNQSAANR
jgi:hypothetical protein